MKMGTDSEQYCNRRIHEVRAHLNNYQDFYNKALFNSELTFEVLVTLKYQQGIY